jgi:hypothetical protein
VNHKSAYRALIVAGVVGDERDAPEDGLRSARLNRLETCNRPIDLDASEGSSQCSIAAAALGCDAFSAARFASRS